MCDCVCVCKYVCVHHFHLLVYARVFAEPRGEVASRLGLRRDVVLQERPGVRPELRGKHVLTSR